LRLDQLRRHIQRKTMTAAISQSMPMATSTHVLEPGCSLRVRQAGCPLQGAEEMAEKDLKALFLHQLKDTYYAENAIVKALPKMAAAAQTEELQGAFAVHLEETKNHVQRLDQVFQKLGEQPEGIECKAIMGIIAEGDEIAQEFAGGEALDAGLIAAAQAVEHYEITRYGTMIAWANQLGMTDVQDLLKETLAEEESTDELLSELAEDAINPAAA
jgi:ferritin-like metal-binding protein YciE